MQLSQCRCILGSLKICPDPPQGCVEGNRITLKTFQHDGKWPPNKLALSRNSWEATPIEGVAGNLLIRREPAPSETVAKSPSIRLLSGSVWLFASPVFDRLPHRGEAGLATPLIAGMRIRGGSRVHTVHRQTRPQGTGSRVRHSSASALTRSDPLVLR